jgi:DNA modification methylase
MKIGDSITVHLGDCRDSLRAMKDRGEKAQMCVTSPPYFGLRDYGTGIWTGGDESCDHIKSINKHGGQRADRDQSSQVFQFERVCEKCGAIRKDNQLGLEQTPEQYIDNMVEVFRCVKDVLADDGTLWLNIGDSYAGSGKGPAGNPDLVGKTHNERHMEHTRASGLVPEGCKPKDLIGIPWMLAFALRADGWYLRQDIIWHKPNPMPESVTDRCTKAHEYIFLLSKRERYFYDLESIREPIKPTTDGKAGVRRSGNSRTRSREHWGVPHEPVNVTVEYDEIKGANKRSVWSVATKPYSGAHFATFPPELIEPCIRAGSREGDIVLDPFGGSGTTAGVCMMLGRKSVLCELNPAYADLMPDRVDNVLESYGFSALQMKNQHSLFGAG